MKPQQLHKYAAHADALIKWAKYSTDKEYWDVITPVFTRDNLTDLQELLGRPFTTVHRWKKQAMERKKRLPLEAIVACLLLEGDE